VCLLHARRPARMPRKTRTVPYTREGGVVRCLGAGMRRLGWQRYIGWQRRLPQVYRMRHAGVQDTERARWGARGARAARGAREAHSEGPEVWAWRAWIEDARRIPPLTQPNQEAGRQREWAAPRLAWLGSLSRRLLGLPPCSTHVKNGQSKRTVRYQWLLQKSLPARNGRYYKRKMLQ
jgi:hypothetical protein